MFTKKFVAFGIATTLLVSMPAFSKSTSLSDLQAVKNARHLAAQSGKEFDKNHWAYQSLEHLSNKYGLDLSGKENLTRNEAAILLVNLVGKIEEKQAELTDSEKMQIKIMQNEFNKELTMLTGRIEKVEEAQKRTFKAAIGENHQLFGAIQAGFTGNFEGRGTDNTPSNFSIPVVDMTMKGKIQDHVFYNINIFPSRNFTSTALGLLGDVYVATDIVDKHNIVLGQKRKPIGLEGSQSPYTLETIRRAQIARTFGDKRDRGITVYGDWGLIDYAGGVYNGSGINTTDNDGSLEYTFIASVNPFHKNPENGELKLGGTFNHGRTTYATTLLDHNTYGFFAKYKYKKLLLQGEYMQKGRHLTANQTASGFYGHASYFVTDDWQVVGRVDRFDPNRSDSAARNFVNEYTVGVNKYFNDHKLKVQCNLIYSQHAAGPDSKKIMLLSQYLI